jgi:hypothetical protein
VKRSSAGWFVAEFGVAFVVGVVGTMIAARRRATPATGGHLRVHAPRLATARHLQAVS